MGSRGGCRYCLWGMWSGRGHGGIGRGGHRCRCGRRGSRVCRAGNVTFYRRFVLACPRSRSRGSNSSLSGRLRHLRISSPRRPPTATRSRPCLPYRILHLYCTSCCYRSLGSTTRHPRNRGRAGPKSGLVIASHVSCGMVVGGLAGLSEVQRIFLLGPNPIEGYLSSSLLTLLSIVERVYLTSSLVTVQIRNLDLYRRLVWALGVGYQYSFEVERV
jgi:hypothetical protein